MKPLLTTIVCLLLLVPPIAHSQELSPRAYWPAPQGTQLLTVGMIWSGGDTIPDPSLPLTGVDSDITTLAIGYLQTISLWGRTTHLVLELPYSSGETVGEFRDKSVQARDYEGTGDLAVSLTVNLMGAPTMDKAGFADLRRNPRPMLGASLKVVAPTGRYDPDRLINVGSNRWAAKAELGYIGLISDKWHYEFQFGAWVFEDNDDFLGLRKQQEPLAALEFHLVRRFTPGLWAALDANFYSGGRSTVGRRELNDLQRDSKLGFTLMYPFAGRNSVRFGYHHGSVNDTDEDFNVISLSYQRLF